VGTLIIASSPLPTPACNRAETAGRGALLARCGLDHVTVTLCRFFQVLRHSHLHGRAAGRHGRAAGRHGCQARARSSTRAPGTRWSSALPVTSVCPR
jgi:hypothetical protein